MLIRNSLLVNNNQNSFDPGTFHTIRHTNKPELHRTDFTKFEVHTRYFTGLLQVCNKVKIKIK